MSAALLWDERTPYDLSSVCIVPCRTATVADNHEQTPHKERANTIHAISTPGNNDSPTPVVEQARVPAASGGDADDVQHEAMDAAARRGNPAAEIARLKEEAEAQERARIAQARAATAKTNAGDTGESKAFLSSK